MADNLTDAFENRALDWLNAVGSPVRPTGPLQVRLIRSDQSGVQPTDSTAGTELPVVGGGYQRQSAALIAAVSGVAKNGSAITFVNMPLCTVSAIELWDTAATAERVWYGALATPKSVNAGDTFTIAANDLSITLG